MTRKELIFIIQALAFTIGVLLGGVLK